MEDLVTMADEQENRDREQTLLYVNAMAFSENSRDDDYVLYLARKRRKLGDIVVDIFLEQVPDKGWWGAVRLNGYFRIQLNLNRQTLFPTPEIALLATEDFLSDEQRVRNVLEDMRKNELKLKTFHHAPARPTDVDPEKYFSPLVLEVNGNFFTLFDLTNQTAAYRSWVQRPVLDKAVELRLAHCYMKGWQAALRFPDSSIVGFEPAIDQLFLTPEAAMNAMLEFCTKEDEMRNLVQRLSEIKPSDQIMVTSPPMLPDPAKPPLHVSDLDFVWQKQFSEGNLYQATQAGFIRETFFRSRKVDIQLIETWDNTWLGALQYNDIWVDFEKEKRVGFSTPEEALAEVRRFIAFGSESLRILRATHVARLLLQREIGRYDRIMSIRTLPKESY